MPLEQRQAWKSLFNHFIFDQGNPAVDEATVDTFFVISLWDLLDRVENPAFSGVVVIGLGEHDGVRHILHIAGADDVRIFLIGFGG